jgi:beta-N-acetylhexosaminidase
LKEKFGFPATVSNKYLGDLNNADSTRFYADKTANTLKSVGINLNLSPVVDVDVNPNSPAIGAIGRSFSSNPRIVSDNAAIVINSHHKQNILTSLKHFPGHGSAANDSHHGFTDVTSTWQQIELEPYRNLINSGYKDFIMTAHIFNANLDPEYPATLSKNIMTGILREQLNYKGVIISDDMGMGAITTQFGLETAVEKSIEAGVDILLFANNLSYDDHIAEKVITIIKSMIAEGKISVNRINNSYQRIITLKKNYNLY